MVLIIEETVIAIQHGVEVKVDTVTTMTDEAYLDMVTRMLEEWNDAANEDCYEQADFDPYPY